MRVAIFTQRVRATYKVNKFGTVGPETGALEPSITADIFIFARNAMLALIIVY